MYKQGQGVEKDEATAVKWYRKAAEQGDACAQTNLGAMYALGQGVPQNLSEALRWFRKAEAAGAPQAASRIQHIMLLLQSQQQRAAEETPESNIPSPAIPIGARVELRGLQAKPELNGQRGEVTGFDAASGRLKVRLGDGRGPFSLKPENLYPHFQADCID